VSDFKAKMHANRFRLGLRPRPRWGSLQRSPDPLTAFGGPTSKGRRRGEGRGSGEGREWEGLKPPQSKFSGYVAAYEHSLQSNTKLTHYRCWFAWWLGAIQIYLSHTFILSLYLVASLEWRPRSNYVLTRWWWCCERDVCFEEAINMAVLWSYLQRFLFTQYLVLI